MPIQPPALDDRRFDDLVEELLARIPAHTPEWTNPRQGDPGRTLIELFAWLGETLLYRANLIPERQRLAFLRLLGVPLRPAVPARGLVTIAIDDDSVTGAVALRPLATIKRPVVFETRSELTVLPVSAEAYCKRPLTATERHDLAPVVDGLQQIYNLRDSPVPYVTTPVFPGGLPEPGGFDLVGRTIDRCLWLALLAPKPEQVAAVTRTLGANVNGGPQLLSVGVQPALAVPALFEGVGGRARIPHTWELSTDGDEYLTLDVIDDATAGLTQRGVLRLALPDSRFIGAPGNDVRQALDAGVGDRPPRLDDPRKAARLVAWLRLRPTVALNALPLSWVGVNACEVDQRQTVTGRVVGQSDGSAGQEFALPGQSIEPESLLLQVEEEGLGYQFWQQVDDLALAGRDAPAYQLDAEAGTVRFGDGIRGRIPDPGRRIRLAHMRAGGGRVGNLPAGALAEISARDLGGAPVTTRLKVTQSLATAGGEDGETLAAAEQRIPALLRNRDRAVTAEDYRHLAAATPGVRLGRVEVLPRFKPQQRRFDVPGVVSVLALPFAELSGPPNPRPDRPLIETVQGYLEARRPVGTELYVIGCEYVPLGISVGVTVRDGFAAGGDHRFGSNGAGPGPGLLTRDGQGREGVLRAVREALRLLLWPLGPGGPEGAGWPLGRTVRDRELEVAVARVPGVSAVLGINLFERRDDDWRAIAAPFELRLQPWQLPELLAVVAVADDAAPGDLRGAPNPFASSAGVAIPVVPELC